MRATAPEQPHRQTKSATIEQLAGLRGERQTVMRHMQDSAVKPASEPEQGRKDDSVAGHSASNVSHPELHGLFITPSQYPVPSCIMRWCPHILHRSLKWDMSSDTSMPAFLMRDSVSMPIIAWYETHSLKISKGLYEFENTTDHISPIRCTTGKVVASTMHADPKNRDLVSVILGAPATTQPSIGCFKRAVSIRKQPTNVKRQVLINPNMSIQAG